MAALRRQPFEKVARVFSTAADPAERVATSDLACLSWVWTGRAHGADSVEALQAPRVASAFNRPRGGEPSSPWSFSRVSIASCNVLTPPNFSVGDMLRLPRSAARRLIHAESAGRRWRLQGTVTRISHNRRRLGL